MRRTIPSVILVTLTAVVFAGDATAIYHPGQGRFMQRDRMGYIDGMNQYQYVKSKPTIALDPSGFLLETRPVIRGNGISVEGFVAGVRTTLGSTDVNFGWR